MAGDPEYLGGCAPDDFAVATVSYIKTSLIASKVGRRERKVVRARFQDANFCHLFAGIRHEDILLHTVRARHAKALEEASSSEA